jgi:hypothetical protein
VLVTVEQRYLVDEHRSQGEARRIGLSPDWPRPVGVEDGLEMLALKFSIAT